MGNLDSSFPSELSELCIEVFIVFLAIRRLLHTNIEASLSLVIAAAAMICLFMN